MSKYKQSTNIQEAPVRPEAVFLRQTGESVTGSRHGRPHSEKQGKKLHRHIDITVLKELDRFRNELLASISQEMRTPLTSIEGFASALLQKDMKWTDEERKEFLERIQEETNHLNHIIIGLLDVSRLESGVLKLDKKQYRVLEIINSIADKMGIINRHHPILQKISPRLPPVYVDRDRIGQVVLNLVQNAAKYSREDMPITIEAKVSHQQVIISVIDKGVGIPVQLQDKVFDRFYQVENIVTGHQSRNDIGLSICRGIIEAHGGKIWVESKVGEGSQFFFTLPVSNAGVQKSQTIQVLK